MRRDNQILGWLSIAEYAEHYRVDPRTVRKWIAAALVDSFTVGRTTRVRDQPPRPNGSSLNPKSCH